MKNANKIAFPKLEVEWKQPTISVRNLPIPLKISIFANKKKNLCESGVDLICSSTSRPCSG